MEDFNMLMDILMKGIYFGGAGYVSYCGYRILKHNKWDEFFKTKGIISEFENKKRLPKLVKKQPTRYGYLLKFSIPIGIGEEDFIKEQGRINNMLNARTGIYYENGYVYVKVYKGNLKSNYSFEKVDTGNKIEILIGQTANGIKKIELGNQLPNAYIAGETGSGKSTLLRGILTNIIINDSENIELDLSDL